MINKNRNQNIISIVLMLTLTVIPTYYAGYDNWSIYGILIILLITASYLLIKAKSEIYLSINSPLLWILLFFIWGACSFIWSVSKVRTIIETIQQLTYILVFVFVIYTSEEIKEKVGKIILLVGTLIGFYGILQYMLVNSQGIVGTFPHHNPFGIYLVMLFSIAWSINLKTKKKIFFVSSLILLIALFLSASRGSILCLVLSFWLIFINFNKKDLISGIKRTFLLITSSLAITFGIIYIAPIIQNLNSSVGILIKGLIRTEDFSPSAIGGRISFWKVALKLFISKPLNGYGLGTYYTSYYSKYEYNGWYSRFAHNTYLQILSEQGVIGLILFIFFLSTCFIIALRVIKKKYNNIWINGAMAGSFAFLLHIGIDFSWNFPGSCIIFFALIGTVVSLEYKNFEKKLIISKKIVISVLTLFLLITVIQVSTEYVGAKGIKLSEDKKYTESNKIFELIQKIYPVNDNIYYLHAINDMAIYAKNKDIKELDSAENLLNKAIKFGPYKWNYYNQLGLIKLNKGNKNQSIKCFESSISYSSYRVDPYLNLGTVYFVNGNIDKSKQTFTKGLEQTNFAYSGLEEIQQESVTNIIAQMDLNLAVIYSKEGDIAMKDKYLNEVNKIVKMHPEIKLYELGSNK